MAFHRSKAAIDAHLADQLLLPLALAEGAATLRAQAISEHTRTNLWLAEQFMGPLARIDPVENVVEFSAK